MDKHFRFYKHVEFCDSNIMMSVSYRHILHLAIPVTLANIVMPLQSLIDTAVVGHMQGSSQLAGMMLAIQLLTLLLVNFNFLQYASSGLTAQAVGQYQASAQTDANLDDDATAPSHPLIPILHRAMLLAMVIGMVVFLTQPLTINVGLAWLGGSASAMIEAKTYLSVRLWGIVAELMNFVFLGFFAGMGKTRHMLYLQSFIAISNIILTLLLVYVFDMGLAGVALGTVIAYWLAVGLALYFICSELTLSWRQLCYWRYDEFGGDKMLRLFSLNRDIFIRTLVLTLSFAWITRLSAMSGDVVLAANGILLQILNLSSFALDGLAVAAENLSGQSHGQGNKQKFWLVVRRTGIMSHALAVMLVLFWWLGIDAYLDLMTDINAVATLAYEYRWYAIMLPLVGVGAYWLDGIFFGMTAGKQIRQAALMVAVLFFPLSLWLYHAFAVAGIWLSVWALLLLRLAVLGWFLRRYRHHPFNKKQKTATQ